MLQNYQPQRNIRSFRRQSCFERPDKATGGGESRKLSTVRWSSGISATILDFRLPQKHVHGHVRMETGRKAGVGEGPGVTNSAAARARDQRQSGRKPMGVSFDKIDGVIWYDGRLVPWGD